MDVVVIKIWGRQRNINAKGQDRIIIINPIGETLIHPGEHVPALHPLFVPAFNFNVVQLMWLSG
jgi:hypothetical protein